VNETESSSITDAGQPWIEALVLSALAAGRPAETISLWFPESAASDADVVASLIEELERRGLVEIISGAGGFGYALTRAGHERLLRLIGQWGATVSEFDAERQQVERLRTDLLSTISHELRTPLTLIRTSIGLLLDSDPCGCFATSSRARTA
jgi:signal transduction histidine kinase